jgi:NDP-sugar pyrophosphorylase family protein
MKAMIFAAGLGTRMRPLTDNLPKALVLINGVPLLEIVIRHLMAYDFREIIINVHYKAEQIIAFLAKNDNFGIHIQISDESDMLLETGGGLQKAAPFFSDGAPFLVCNCDILSNINLDALVQTHIQSEAIATMAIRNRITSRYLLFDDNLSLCGWQNTKTDELRMSKTAQHISPYGFSSFQILTADFLRLLPTHITKYSIIDVYLEAAKQHKIQGFLHNNDTWADIGTPKHIAEGELVLKSMKQIHKSEQ